MQIFLALPQIYWIRNSGCGFSNVYFNKPSGWFWCTLKLETHIWSSLQACQPLGRAQMIIPRLQRRQLRHKEVVSCQRLHYYSAGELWVGLWSSVLNKYVLSACYVQTLFKVLEKLQDLLQGSSVAHRSMRAWEPVLEAPKPGTVTQISCHTCTLQEDGVGSGPFWCYWLQIQRLRWECLIGPTLVMCSYNSGK